MPNKPEAEWILPASIPFSDLKGRDLEECIYWLLDAMGAQDLEWRVGGTGGGAADQGRDLEALFYMPTVDGEMEAKKWWIECKGRSGTLEPDAVKSAVNNALAIEGLDYVVIATNTTFSNPTRDWVKSWQGQHSRPKIKMWDHTQLERFLSRHPAVVLRLFSQALSMQGRLQAIESRFWNRSEFCTQKILAEVWKARDDLEFSSMGLFAVIVNEFANGNISNRPWGAHLDTETLANVITIAFVNVPYFMMRSVTVGADEEPTCRAMAYLILVALDRLPAENVANLVIASIDYRNDNPLPDNVMEVLLMPVIDQLVSELGVVCGSDCRRVTQLGRHVLSENSDEADLYWVRLEPGGIEEKVEREQLNLINLKEPCQIGFTVDDDYTCPFLAAEPSINNLIEVLEIVKRVTAYRKAEFADKRSKRAQR